MPSWRIHRKYGELLGIDEEIQKRIDEFIDRYDHHDFFDHFIEKTSTQKFRALGNVRILCYYFDSSSFLRSEMYKEIEKYGEEGIKCFFLHVFLDIIERNTRFRNTPDIIIFEDLHGLLRNYIDEVGRFMEDYYEEILEDIRRYRRRKGQGTGRTVGMVKGTLINAILSSLFRDMSGVVYPYGPKMVYYRKIIKDYGIEYFLSELKRHGDYNTFIQNLKKNFTTLRDEIIFPEVMGIIEKYDIDEILSNESLLKEFLRRIFRVRA